MNYQQRCVRELHKKHGRTIRDKPETDLVQEIGGNLRIQMGDLQHEVTNLSKAKELPDIAQDLIHVLYHVYSIATFLGIDLQPIFAIVHRANMKRNAKEPYQPPLQEIHDCLRKQGWNPD
jgi:predicted HAD superfamily Cof-like phosphohydrolase